MSLEVYTNGVRGFIL